MLPHFEVIAFTGFSETLTSDLVLEVTQIQTHLRFLVDIINQTQTVISSYRIDKLG